MRLISLLGLVAAALPLTTYSVTVESDPDHKMAVVELYTSEGCSSCPPADKKLSRLGRQANPLVLPLAFHVDYWDYLGWKDAFSSPRFTARQRHLGQLNRQRTIYTPEFFVNGKEARRQNLSMIEHANADQPGADLKLDFELSETGLIQVTLTAKHIVDGVTPQLYFVVTENGLSNAVERGENNGRTLHHDHVVRYWSEAISITNSQDNPAQISHQIELDPKWASKQLLIAAIIEDADTGQTLQAVASPVITGDAGES